MHSYNTRFQSRQEPQQQTYNFQVQPGSHLLYNAVVDQPGFIDNIRDDIRLGLVPTVVKTQNHTMSLSAYTAHYVKEVASQSGGRVDIYHNSKMDANYRRFINDTRCEGLQFKTTASRVSRLIGSDIISYEWSFSGVEGYSGLLIVLHALDTGVFFVVPYDELRHGLNGTSLHVCVYMKLDGTLASRRGYFNWGQYMVTPDQLIPRLNDYFDRLPTSTVLANRIWSRCGLPRSYTHQIEGRYLDRLTEMLDRLRVPWAFPLLENGPFDIFINGIRCQARLCQKRSDMTRYTVYLTHLRNGEQTPFTTEEIDAFILLFPEENYYDSVALIPLTELVGLTYLSVHPEGEGNTTPHRRFDSMVYDTYDPETGEQINNVLEQLKS